MTIRLTERFPKDGRHVAINDKSIETGGLSRNDLDKALRIVQRENASKGRGNRRDLNQQLLKTGTNGGTESDND